MLKTEIIKVLQYFDIFRFPLKEQELLRYLTCEADEEQLHNVLQEMVSDGQICHRNDNFMVYDNMASVQRKEQGAHRAAGLKRKAFRVARIIWYFPFVRGIAISGSLSKNFADEKSDLDFFIITAPRTLWVCRTLLHIFKRFTFWVGKQHNFCMNYFIDESKLAIEEENLFTAYEMCTLIPCEGAERLAKLHDANTWVWRQLPNAKSFMVYPPVSKIPFFKTCSEMILRFAGVLLFNKTLMKWTDRKWRKKWQRRNYDMSQYDLAFKTTEFVSKNHPKNYQKFVLEQLKK